MQNGTQVAFLGGHQRKTFRQVKPHLVAKHTDGTCAGAVFLASAVIAHVAHQVEVLLHAFLYNSRITS